MTTTDLLPKSLYVDGQSKAECLTIHGLLESTAETEELIQPAIPPFHNMIGMHAFIL